MREAQLAAANDGEPPAPAPSAELPEPEQSPEPTPESTTHGDPEPEVKRTVLTFHSWAEALPSMLDAFGLPRSWTGLVIPHPSHRRRVAVAWYLRRLSNRYRGWTMEVEAMSACREVQPMLEAVDPLGAVFGLAINEGKLSYLFEYARPMSAPHCAENWIQVVPVEAEDIDKAAGVNA